VIALNPKTGLPDKTLQRDDFQIFDNDRPVAIATFDSGGQLRARPVALWFLLQCSMQKYDREGSGFFRGRMNLFTPALKNLDKHDTVAVAHWCDNGAAQVDLRPTTNVDAAVTTAEQVLAPTVNVDNHDRPGELALQKSLQLIVDTTRSLTPEPAPVVVFLYGDWSGMPRAEADHFIGELLETSAIVYGLKDSRSGAMPIPLRLLGSAFQEQMEVAKYIATQTGGEYASVAPETYSTSLEEILRQLHFRYELGFKPEALDGKRHKLEVKLAAGAKKQRHGVRLRYRPAYVPARQETR